VELNEIVLEAGGGKVGLSLIMGSLECDSGGVTLLQFGHPFPFLFGGRGDAAGASPDAVVTILKPLGNHGLGSARFPNPQAQRFQMRDGQGLFLYTDGLVENFKGRMTTKRIRRILAGSNAFGDAVESVVHAYSTESDGGSDVRGEDDTAVLAIHWHGRAENEPWQKPYSPAQGDRRET
jgi:hypothetical protein